MLLVAVITGKAGQGLEAGELISKTDTGHGKTFLDKSGMEAVAMMLMFLTGCNRQVIDTTFSYDNAILALPDGSVISGKIESWKDYDDGDQIQVKIDGTTYLVHSVNIVLIKE